MSLAGSTLVRDYVCAVCKSPLKLTYDFENRRSVVVCTQNPAHFGVWRKAFLDRERKLEAAQAACIIFDRELRELMPWLPKPEKVDADVALAELFEF